MLGRLTLAAILIGAGMASVAAAPTPSYPTPGLQPNTTALSPGKDYDRQSWEAFITVVKPVGTPPLATFETWKSDEDIYTNAGQLQAQAKPAERFSKIGLNRFRMASHPLKRMAGAPVDGSCAVIPGGGTTPSAGNNPGNFPKNGCVAEEVRRDPASTQYILGNNLNTLAGLKANFTAGTPIQFPIGAIEIKADWVPVDDLIAWLARNGKTVTRAQVEAEYYLTTDKTVTYALVSMHLSEKTKELPNWLWATFEHEWNPGRCDSTGCWDQFGASVAQVPSAPQANSFYPDCATKSPELAALFAAAGMPSSVWSHYCLKGSQIDTTTAGTTPANGPQATVDGDSVIERILAQVPVPNSSCISCHGTASFTKEANFNPAVGFNVLGPVVNPSDYKSYDFLWGLIKVPNINPGY